MDMKSKDILNLFYWKFKFQSKSKFKFSNITSKYLFMNHFNTICAKNIKSCNKISFLLIILKKIFIKSVQLGYRCFLPKKYNTISKEINKVKTLCDFYILIILFLIWLSNFHWFYFIPYSLIWVNFC